MRLTAFSPSKQRNASVFGIALTELFILLLFLAIFLWVATAPAKTLPTDVRIAHLEKRLKEFEEEQKRSLTKIAHLENELRGRDDQLKLLWEYYKRKPLTLSPGTPEWKKWLDQWHEELKKGPGLGGRGHANCLGRGAGPILTITARDDGIAIQPELAVAQNSAMLAPSGVPELASRKFMSIAQFELLGEKVLHWSDRQQPVCRFDVIFVDQATQKKPYADTIKAIDRVFYKKQRAG